MKVDIHNDKLYFLACFIDNTRNASKYQQFTKYFICIHMEFSKNTARMCCIIEMV